MRRGHPGPGGWRSENPRPFRPRGSVNHNFRSSRPFGLLDLPRFPPPGPRQYRGPRPFSQHPGRQDQHPELRDRNKYRLNNAPRSQGRGYHNHGQVPVWQLDTDEDSSYGESNSYQNPNQFRVNSMGDVDHRRQHTISPWVNNPPGFENNRQYRDGHRSPQKTHYNKGDDLPDYSGHRPPASDHYCTTTGPNNNNSQYLHSVDDTVDIIRQRLKNRDKQQNFDTSMDHPSNVDEDLRKSTEDNYRNVPQEQPVRKKNLRHKQNTKLNCDKMKNKIVHQLFKMDKTKIHKLMDDPSSSTKFEYAISSLITEGQNSLNKHLRSAAEKSLCSSSTDFIHDDTNTIYEDTFMKQMQGVLDPQDTVLLEDIKPLVMAELSRVLQLDNYQFDLMQEQGFRNQGIQDHGFETQGMQDHRFENQSMQGHGFEHQGMQEHEIYDQGIHEHEMYDHGIQSYANEHEPSNCQYLGETQESEQFSRDIFCDQNNFSTGIDNGTEVITGDLPMVEYKQESCFESKPLFERRPAKRVDENEHRKSTEGRQSRNSTDKSLVCQQKESIECSPKEKQQTATGFDPNSEQFSDDDDPFAELDKQYHVAVDPIYIEYASRPPSPVFSCETSSQSPNHAQNINIEIPNATTSEAKTNLDTHSQNTAKSSIKLFSNTGNLKKLEPKNKLNVEVKKDPEHILEKENLTAIIGVHVETKNHTSCEESSKTKETKKEVEKHDNSTTTKSILQSNTRKRSIDQKPSHRKEKRKRSSQSECQEAAKSILNMFYTGDNGKEHSKTSSKKVEPIKTTYSDKYVKRKEPQNKAKERNCENSKAISVNKQNSTSSHSITSPKDNSSEIPPKSDAKKKLKPIDIFGAQLPKKSTAHQAHRNTASIPQDAKSPDNKPKLIPIATSFARKLSRRHIGTQVIIKVKNKDCQTEKSKNIVKQTQTEPVSFNEEKRVSSNPLERMKEIDMEIQILLQEKFKLYHSLETKAATTSIDTIPSLTMRVFKVNTDLRTESEGNDSEDAIVDDFTSIPAEELEQIAMETIANDEPPVKSTKKKNQRKKVIQVKQETSASPPPKRNKKRSTSSPNISLIEQIITDDRPIEDIISLDDLEILPVKSKKKSQKVLKKKSTRKANTSKVFFDYVSYYKIKDCSIVLKRIDISKYLKSKKPDENLQYSFEVPVIETPVENFKPKEELPPTSETNPTAHEEIQSIDANLVQVVEDVVNELQFDMLDVSEDIVIGDNCEAKTIDKVKEPITEEIILDNSQSSIEDGAPETASADDECKMYDYSNENLRRDSITVTGNADAVLAIECVDNQFIAACLDGNVYHFSEDGQLLNTLRGTNQAVTCLTIVKEKYGTTVYTGSLDSRMRYYDLETGLEKGPECNVLSPIQTMDRAWDTIFVGTRTGFVLQFECKNNMVIPVSTVKFSEQSILALRAMKEGPRKVLLVAARSENVVTVKDAQTGLLLRTLQGPKMSVYTLLYEDGKVYCGTSSHNIHVFDYTTGNHVGTHEGGKGAVCLRASGGLVFAGCYDGCVYVYREGEARPRAQLRGPALMLLSLAIHGTKIIAGYKDRGLYIWKMPSAIVQEMIL